MTDSEKTFLSKKKYNELVGELELLKNTKRQEIAKQLEEAKAFGDLSENAEYHEARDAQAVLEDRIRELEYILKNAEIIKHRANGEVEIGSKVVVKKGGERDEKTFEIVGSEEANTKEGRISHTSPLGQALLGKKNGEKAEFKTPTGKMVSYKIIKIE